MRHMRHPPNLALTNSPLLPHVTDATAPLVPLNPGYTLHHSASVGIILDCGTKTGKYTVRIDHEEQKLVLQSPISGTLEYFFDPSPGMFRSNDIRMKRAACVCMCVCDSGLFFCTGAH